MANNPKVYGFCDAGCKRRVPNYDEFVKGAAIVLVNNAVGADGVELPAMRKYKFITKAGQADFNGITATLSVLNKNSGNVESKDIDLTTYPYDEYGAISFFTLEVIGLCKIGTTSTYDIVAEVNGYRKTYGILSVTNADFDLSTATLTVKGVDAVYVYNSDAKILVQGEKGEKGEKGVDGIGVPTGGTAGQILKKKSNTDYDYEWVSVESHADTKVTLTVTDGLQLYFADLYNLENHGGCTLIDWGDGVVTEIKGNTENEMKHTYETGGTYTITFVGLKDLPMLFRKKNVQSVEIGASVERIKDCAFNENTDLTEVTIYAENPPTIYGTSTVNKPFDDTVTKIYVHNDKYLTAEGWDIYADKLYFDYTTNGKNKTLQEQINQNAEGVAKLKLDGARTNKANTKVTLTVTDGLQLYFADLYNLENHGGCTLIDWGDGVVTEIKGETDNEMKHTYATGGTYTITFVGLKDMPMLLRKKNVKAVEIGASVERIRDYAFNGNTDLTEVTIYAENPPTIYGTSTVNKPFDDTVTKIYVHNDKYLTAEGWDIYADKLYFDYTNGENKALQEKVDQNAADIAELNAIGVKFGEVEGAVNAIEYNLNSEKTNKELETSYCNGLNAAAIDILAQILSAGTYSVDITDKIEALKSALKLREDEITLRLPRNLPVDTYTLKYENAGGEIGEYLDICSFEITEQAETPNYNKFIKENCSPFNSVIIGIYNSSNERVGDIVLGALSHDLDNLGEKLYSFAAFSDIHIGDREDYVTRFQNVINDLVADDNISLIAICGDMVDDANKTEQLEAYQSVAKTVEKPILTTMGNHEITNLLAQNKNRPNNPLFYEDIRPYFEQTADASWGIDRTLHYCYTPNGSDDVFIMFGISGLYSLHASLSADDIKWLQNILEENRNKRCFLFHHYFPWEGSGDAVNCYSENGLQGNGGESLYSLLKHYKNVIYFHGHTHAKFRVQEYNPMNTIDTIFGRYSIHIPSLTNPTDANLSARTYIEDANAGEGYIVDVYENGILLKGKDFVKNKYSPIGCYFLDTTIKEVAANTYYDEYGYTAQSFKSGSEWFTGCTLDKTLITKISFVDTYMDAYDESWDPTIGENGRIVAYRNGTELYIAGNGNIIKANANAKEMFAGFTSLLEIEGLYRLDMTNVTDIEGMFSGCKKIKTLNLQSFNTALPSNMKNVFNECAALTYLNLFSFNMQNVTEFHTMCKGCSSLIEVVLPIKNINVNSTLYFNSTFENCSALKYIDMTRFTGMIYYSSTFQGCVSLIEVKFGNTQLKSFASLFSGCTNIEVIDISNFDISSLTAMTANFKNCTSLTTLILPTNFDTSKITSMVQLFANCPALTLDCSAWDTTSLTNVYEFNKNSPNVIAPFAE